MLIKIPTQLTPKSRLRPVAKVLPTSEYFIKLKGQTDSDLEDIADYSFIVEKND